MWGPRQSDPPDPSTSGEMLDPCLQRRIPRPQVARVGKEWGWSWGARSTLWGPRFQSPILLPELQISPVQTPCRAPASPHFDSASRLGICISLLGGQEVGATPWWVVLGLFLAPYSRVPLLLMLGNHLVWDLELVWAKASTPTPMFSFFTATPYHLKLQNLHFFQDSRVRRKPSVPFRW